MKRELFIVTCVLGLAAACATGSGNGDPGKDSGITGKDGSTTKDTGTTGSDTGTTNKDTGTVDTCQKAAPSNVCGVYPQCDCGASQTCEVDQSALDGSTSCVPAGTKQIGQACTATASQCAAGLTCIWGQCHAYCGQDGATCTNANTNACINLTDGTNPIPNLLICHNDCELADANSCGGSGEGCVYFDVDQVDCYPVGTTTANCNATSSFCPAGQLCLTDQTNYFCLPYCREGQNDCKTGTCMTLGSGAPTVNGVAYGYCQ